MNRNEQIAQACARERSVSEERAFTRGALWADRNPADCWIRIEEELPGDERVLFYAPPSGMLIGRLVDGIWWANGISYKMSDVTHWQSLPQPPRKEDEL